MKGLATVIYRMWVLVAICSAAISCADKRPDHILSRADMVQIMEEMYLAEEKINQLGVSRDSAKQVFKAMRKQVFESVAVEDSVFKKSFDYYMERPKEMELIYTALVDTLQLREQRAPLHTQEQ